MSTGSSILRTTFIENNLTSTDATNYLGADQGPVITGLISSVSKGLRSMQIFESNGTWNKPAGITLIMVEVVGGGGGAGGCPTSGNPPQSTSGGGGGAGFSRKLIDVSALGSESVTIGLGGLGGTGAQNGANGGASSFGASISATGGLGGAQGISSAGTLSTSGGLGGTGVGGDLNISGSSGQGGRLLSGITVRLDFGGGSFYGLPQAQDGNGTDYGGGAPGRDNAVPVDVKGGDGGDGVVIVYEYIT